MAAVIACPHCDWRNPEGSSRCQSCARYLWKDELHAPDVHARTTVGAAFVEPGVGERLTVLLTEFLHGRIAGSGTSADLHQQAEAVARNLAQVILNRFSVTERK